MKNKMYSNPPRKPMMYGGMAMPKKKMAMGGKGMKEVPSDNKGLAKLPKEVRNNMGYMMYGGKVKK